MAVARNEIPETIIGAWDEVEITEHDILTGKEARDGNASNVETHSRILKENLKHFTETKNESKFVRNLVHTLRKAGSRFLRVNNNNVCTEIGDKKVV